MTKSDARYLSRNHKFTKRECYEILKKALDSESDAFWKKPSSNPIIDLGAYFNQCVEWLDYKEELNGQNFAPIEVVFRILHFFGKYAKTQPYQKVKPLIKIEVSEKPKLV